MANTSHCELNQTRLPDERQRVKLEKKEVQSSMIVSTCWFKDPVRYSDRDTRSTSTIFSVAKDLKHSSNRAVIFLRVPGPLSLSSSQTAQTRLEL